MEAVGRPWFECPVCHRRCRLDQLEMAFEGKALGERDVAAGALMVKIAERRATLLDLNPLIGHAVRTVQPPAHQSSTKSSAFCSTPSCASQPRERQLLDQPRAGWRRQHGSSGQDQRASTSLALPAASRHWVSQAASTECGRGLFFRASGVARPDRGRFLLTGSPSFDIGRCCSPRSRNL